MYTAQRGRRQPVANQRQNARDRSPASALPRRFPREEPRRSRRRLRSSPGAAEARHAAHSRRPPPSKSPDHFTETRVPIRPFYSRLAMSPDVCQRTPGNRNETSSLHAHDVQMPLMNMRMGKDPRLPFRFMNAGRKANGHHAHACPPSAALQSQQAPVPRRSARRQSTICHRPVGRASRNRRRQRPPANAQQEGYGAGQAEVE